MLNPDESIACVNKVLIIIIIITLLICDRVLQNLAPKGQIALSSEICHLSSCLFQNMKQKLTQEISTNSAHQFHVYYMIQNLRKCSSFLSKI